MNGLMPARGQMAPQQSPMSGQAQAAPDWLSAEEQAATPEEQDLYDRVVAQALRLIYSKETDLFDSVLGMLTAGDPVDALAKTAAMVMHKVKQAAGQQNVQISGDILLHAGAEVFEDLAGLATKISAHDFVKDKKAFDAAWLRALDQFRLLEEQAGTLDKQAIGAEFEQVVAADKDGRLPQMLSRKMEASGFSQKNRPPAPANDNQPRAGLGAKRRRRGKRT